MELKLSELEELFDLVVSKLRTEGVESIEIEQDMYRFIPASEWQKFEKAEIAVGSIMDDIDSLKKLLVDKDRPCTFVDFDRVASVLNAVSETYNPSQE